MAHKQTKTKPHTTMLKIAPSPLNHIIGGVTFMFRLNKTGGYHDLGDIDANSIKFAAERGIFYSKRTGVKRRRNSWLKSLDITFKISGPDATQLVTQMATLSSTPSAQTQASGTGVSEAIVAVRDAWVCLGKQNVSSLVAKDSTNATTYVLDTDYELDVESGMFRALSTGAIADGATVNTTYSHAAMTALTEMNIGQTGRFVGDSFFLIRSSNGHVSRFYFPSVEIQPDGDLSFDTENPANVASFTGSVLWDSTQGSGAEMGKFQELVKALTSA